MNALEPVIVTVLVVVAFNAGLAYAFIAWGRWLSRTYDAPRWLRWSGVIPSALWLVLLLLSALSFMRAFDMPPGSSAADRQRILANAIAEGMYNALFAMVTQLAGGATLLFLTWRYRWSKKLPKAQNDPPYR